MVAAAANLIQDALVNMDQGDALYNMVMGD